MQVKMKLVLPTSQNLNVHSLIQTENLLNYFSKQISSFLDNIDKNSKLNLTAIRTMSKELLDNHNDYGSLLKSITKSRTIDEYLTTLR